MPFHHPHVIDGNVNPLHMPGAYWCPPLEFFASPPSSRRRREAAATDVGHRDDLKCQLAGAAVRVVDCERGRSGLVSEAKNLHSHTGLRCSARSGTKLR